MGRARKPSSRGKYDRSLSSSERKATQRIKLLDAATAVFAKVGYQNATVEAIVDRAGMSRRTYYEHFTDLRDALGQVYDRAAMVSLTMVSSAARAYADPLDALRAGITAYLTAAATYPDVARVMFAEYRLGGSAFEARYQKDSDHYAELLNELLAAAFKQKKIKRAPSEIAVFTIAKGIEALTMRSILRDDYKKLPERADELFTLLLASVR